MKKVAFLCCLFYGLITQAVGATNNCKPQKIDSHASKEARVYLYVGESNWKDRMALVCGDGCEHKTVVVVSGEFYFEGFRYDYPRSSFVCLHAPGGTSWEYLQVLRCSEADKARLKKVNIHYNNGYDYYAHDVKYGSGYAAVDDICYESKDWIPENKGTDPYATTNASEKESAQDAKQTQPGGAGEKSEKKPAQGAKQTQPGGGTSGTGTTGTGATGTGTSGTGTSAQKQPGDGTSAQGAKQTQPGDAGKKSEKKPEQGTGQTKSGDAGKKSETTSAQGAKQTKSGDAGKKSEKKPGRAQSTAPEEKKSQCELNKPGWRWFEGRCITDAKYQDILAERQARALTQEIENAASQLDSISSNFKVSEWKDAEGKFNTARLASDSIAGVVLGTAGGLITSHVVKKNQVENGFQDIKCTIGGQSVANWGDEFSVGIQ